ncbi:SPOR domain-containing protein [Psychroflexus sp. YR1-1]|uniref:SPOR domain-containing protein n=1 Tax=Psychroflexus aurantiacus TaxID=2709310 RepID=A0A6B3R4U1_9FLAO|nr:SPOR domain-containing protein [Psychroflexus aurantiacus]NEV94187.1 SPOR domain-containing protein [Psychroflexus aurantiacus]
MPILTEQELQEIENQKNEAIARLKEKEQELLKVYKEKRNLKGERRGLVFSTLLFGLLFLAMIYAVMFQPALFGLKEGNPIAEDEVVVKESTLNDYQAKISELEAQASQAASTEKLEEFYAVQLGAFKTFNVNLSSGQYNLLNKAEYKDFDLYTMGVFETKAEAEELRKVLSRLNFKDAFVGLYRNGERVKAFY